MKMKTRIAFAGLVLALVAPVFAYAMTAAISLVPSSGTLAVGATKVVNIYVTPEDGAVYTAKVTVHFPAALLHVDSFTPASGVIALSQPGYDLVDNAGGVLVKTVGFPKGATSQTLVGTIVFSGAHAGSAQVSVDSGSLALEVNNSNAASSFGTALFTITAPASTGTKTSPGSSLTQTQPSHEGSGSGVAASVTHLLPSASSVAEAAAALSVCALSLTGLSWLLVIVAFIAGVLVGRKTMRKSRKELKKEEKKKNK